MVQYHSRQQFRVLRGTRQGRSEGTGGRVRRGTDRNFCVHRNQERAAFQARCADEETPDRGGCHWQCNGPCSVVQSEEKSVFFYEDRKWTSPFAGGSHEFFDKGERVLDDRTFFHYLATGITLAMASSAVGKGSAYAGAAMDSKGEYLDGGKTYKVTLPKPVPAKNFWSFMVYSGQHRSILETDQKTGGVDSKSPDIKANQDGSYTVWFGPKAPKGHEGNWIQTIPGKSYNVLFRLYGPLEPWFDKSWKLGDFEQVK